jgi:ubiquitin-like modifier-activating enzyme ATG7
MAERKVFQYVQLTSLVHPDFWHKLSEIKLDIEKLNESEREIYGIYSNLNAKNCFVEYDCTAFKSSFSTAANNNLYCSGVMKNFNTVESFKNCDKNGLLKRQGERLLTNIENGSALKDPSILTDFILLTYADLKKYNFYFWFAFTASIEPVVYEALRSQPIGDAFSITDVEKFALKYHALDQRQATFFIATRSLDIVRLQDAIKVDEREANLKDFDLKSTYFCFTDPSEFENPGWMLRNFILCLVKLCPIILGQSVNILSIRRNEKGSLIPSTLFFIDIPNSIELDPVKIKWTGWERNDQGKLLPKLASMGDSMEPSKISEHFSMLNLKLMKWRLLPSLDLEIIKRQKCLLFGAGTLGCAIARSLLSWGVNKITFIDNGRVSYSNPVRQSLFTHADAMQNKFKATTAAERLLEILPSAKTAGHAVQIPMPGHIVTDTMKDKTIESIGTIIDLIQKHDVLFLVTDSRESRWLPTLLGSFYGKVSC